MHVAEPVCKKRSPQPATLAQAQGGWHWTEWGCELAGTALLLLGGLSGLFLSFSPASPLAPTVSVSLRLLITGLILAATGVLVTISPLGRRSGAHLNPSVSFAFWRRGHMHNADLAGYMLAQAAGAIIGTAIARWAWGANAVGLQLGATHPGRNITAIAAAAIEAGLTFVLITGILLAVSSPKTARWTPAVAWGLVALLVWQGGSLTGASLNPARSLAPAVLAPHTADLWAYLVGPLAGSWLAVVTYNAFSQLETRTAKLFHDPNYRSTLATTLPVAIAPETCPN
jgi:aquaporin Z